MGTEKTLKNRTNVEKSTPVGDSPYPSAKDYSISGIRLIAFLCIVSCHILQYLNNELAWWLNVGVQVFLFISGCLYGKIYAEKQIKCFDFYKKRLLKIIIPYYIVILPVVILHFFVLNDRMSAFNYVKLVFGICNIKGGEHLWFIVAILVNYALTPLYTAIFKKVKKNFFVLCVLITVAGLSVVFYFLKILCKPAWVICYFLGYVYGFNEKKRFVSIKVFNIILIALSLQNVAQIVNDYCYTFFNPQNSVYLMWCDYNHVWLGIALFIGLRAVFKKMKPEKKPALKKVLKVSDQYSYEGYLVHQFIILGPLSLMHITNILLVNILIILFLIAVFAFCVKEIETLIYKIERKKRMSD